jgi:hypothetical protein
MNILIALLVGALIGGLNGVGIFFEPREPYKIEILLAATLKGNPHQFVVTGLVTGCYWRILPFDTRSLR